MFKKVSKKKGKDYDCNSIRFDFWFHYIDGYVKRDDFAHNVLEGICHVKNVAMVHRTHF